MKIIKEQSEMIEDEIEGAHEYAKKAAEYKAEHRKLTEVLYELSTEEMSRIKRLHDEVARMIADYREKKGDPPADMLAVYDYLHKKHIEQVAEVKRYQDVYKSM